MNTSNIIKAFNKSKIYNYDIVYIYSDLRYFLLKNKKDPIKFVEDIIQYFLENNITLIIPTFSYSKKIFDINKSTSKLGFLSNYILSRKDSLRSVHPIFSYASIGKKKSILKNIGKSAFGSDCLYSRLIFKNACCLHLGRSLKKGNTLVHHIEQNYKASYRFDKNFKIDLYKNTKKVLLKTNYKAYVKKMNLNKDLTEFTFDKVLKKLYKEKFIHHYGDDKNFNNIDIYSFDKIYLYLHLYYLENKNIFIKKNA